jgi:hypothetical protein
MRTPLRLSSALSYLSAKSAHSGEPQTVEELLARQVSTCARAALNFDVTIATLDGPAASIGLRLSILAIGSAGVEFRPAERAGIAVKGVAIEDFGRTAVEESAACDWAKFHYRAAREINAAAGKSD